MEAATVDHLVEIEHKRPGALSILLVYAENGGRIEARRFDYFIKAVARLNRPAAVQYDSFKNRCSFTVGVNSARRSYSAMSACNYGYAVSLMLLIRSYP